MSHIVCQPDNVSVAFDGETNVLKALVGAGVPITHLCGGKARCSTCRVKVSEGLSQLSAPTEKEEAMAQRLGLPSEIRLACQMTASVSVTLRRMVFDEADAAMASQIGRRSFRGPIGREVEVAVMFADVAGYSAMAEALPPYDIVHMLNRFFTGAGAVVEANSGRVDNYMGDAILALFGVNDEPMPTVAAIRSGLGVLKVATDLNRYVERIYGKTFKVRVGIDFGEAVFGLLGAEGSARETAVGDVVNVASRLQNANKDVGTNMLVSEAVFATCADHIHFGRDFVLDVRGKVGRVTAHEVLGLRQQPGATDEHA
jgi:class 3 adenylate cyclase